MTQLAFTVTDVVADRFAASPQLLFRIRIDETSGARIHSLALRAQIMIEPQRRQYEDGEAATLQELFGDRGRWKDTLRPFLWTHASTVVKGFTESIEIDLPVACSYDVEVAGSKFLHSLADGLVPVRLLFSGTVFSRNESAAGISVEQVPWDLEAEYRFEVARWRELMDQFFPGGGWIRLDRETIDALLRFRGSRGLISWEQVMGTLLDGARNRTDPDRDVEGVT